VNTCVIHLLIKGYPF